MQQRDVEIVNKLGLHARPSARLTQLASTFKSSVHLSRNGRRVNAKSIMGVMMLAAAKGTTITLETEGDGILVLTDVYGATPSNTLCRLLEPAHIEGVSGVNLPMLLKALNYRDTLALPQLIERIVEGGRNSINHISETMCHAATGR